MWKFEQNPSSPTHSDQLPFLSRRHFSTLPSIRRVKKVKNLSVFFATLCVIDLFGVFPIIALPRALILCGLYGIPLTLFVITLQIYTAVILGRCWIIAEKLDPSIVKKNRYPYAAIAELTYGKYMSLFVTILLDLTVFGGGIPNLLVASQNLQLLGHRISDGNFYFSFCYWLILIGVLLCPVMWLGSPKNMKGLASVSVITVTTVAVLTWCCIIADKEVSRDGKFYGIHKGFPPFLDLLNAYGILAFQLDLHPMLLTIQVDMENKRKIGKAVCYGIFTTISMAAVSTILTAYYFGSKTPNNVLEILPRSGALYATILLVTLQLCLSSAVGSSALFQHIENCLGISRDFSVKRCIIRSVLVGFEVLIGEFLPRFDVIMGLIGGTLTGPLIFILPPLFYTKICRLEKIYDEEISQRILYERIGSDNDSNDELDNTRRRCGYEQIHGDDAILIRSPIIPKLYNSLKSICLFLHSDCVLSMAVIAFGLIATLISTYINLFKVTNLISISSPCIGNISYSFSDL